jgi:hypothetical protein
MESEHAGNLVDSIPEGRCSFLSAPVDAGIETYKKRLSRLEVSVISRL